MLHDETIQGRVAKKGPGCPAAGLQILQSGKFVADLVIQVHLTSRVDAQNQFFPVGVLKCVIGIVFATAQRDKIQLGFWGKTKRGQESLAVKIVLKFFGMDHKFSPKLRR